MHQAGEAVVLVERIAVLNGPDEPGFAGLDHDIRPLVFVGIEIDVLGLAHQAVEQRREVRQPFHALNSGHALGLLLGEFVAFPGGDEITGFAQEQNLPLAFVIRLGKEKENAFLLLDAAEVEKVGVGNGSHQTVGIGGHEIIGVHDHQRFREEEPFETVPVVNEELRVNRFVAHDGRSLSAKPGNYQRRGLT